MSVLNFLWSVVSLLDAATIHILGPLYLSPKSALVPGAFSIPSISCLCKSPHTLPFSQPWLLLIGCYFPSSLSSGERHFFLISNSWVQPPQSEFPSFVLWITIYMFLAQFWKGALLALISLFLACFSGDIILLLIHRGYYRNYIENAALVILLLLILVWIQLTWSWEFLHRVALVYFILP